MAFRVEESARLKYRVWPSGSNNLNKQNFGRNVSVSKSLTLNPKPKCYEMKVSNNPGLHLWVPTTVTILNTGLYFRRTSHPVIVV